MARNTAWLNQVQEKTIDPNLPICDPHHHLWEFKHERVADRYLMNEIQEDLNAGHNIVSTVFIEAHSMYRKAGPAHLRVVGETEFVNGIAAMSASGLYGKTQVAAGIVGTADCLLGAARTAEVLDAHIVAGGGAKGRFRGIRQIATWDPHPDVFNGRVNPQPGMYLDSKFREGFAELAPRNLTFDAWCYFPQIPELTDLAKAFPDTKIVLNHFGGPVMTGHYAGMKDEVFKQWRKSMTDLAKCPNVYAKLGGLNMHYIGFDWHLRPLPPTSDELVKAYAPYFKHTIDRFGPDRCMFESNFPVDMISCSYNVLWNANKKMVKGASAKEKAAMFHDTATGFYRL
jgi:L-fuconolactonase